MPLSGKVTLAEPAEPGAGLASYWSPNGKQANVFYIADKGEPCNAPVYNWALTGAGWTNGQLQDHPDCPLLTVSR
jgi:hypothetical protein